MTDASHKQIKITSVVVHMVFYWKCLCSQLVLQAFGNIINVTIKEFKKCRGYNYYPRKSKKKKKGTSFYSTW